MSIQGPTLVVAENPAADLVEALRAAGSFPIVEAGWADAPTAFNSVKPVAIIIADPGPPVSEASARMLCLQVATATGPMVPVLARVNHDSPAPIPIALCIGADASPDRLIGRLRSALRVRSLHSTVRRRIESFASKHGRAVRLPAGDALEDATVLVVGRGKLYPELSSALASRVGVAGALSVESAVQHLNARDIEGIVVGDGLSPRMIEAFLTELAQDQRFRDLPVMVSGEVPADLASTLPNVEAFEGPPARLIERMVPFVRMRAFEARMKRMLASLDAEGVFDPQTGLLTREAFASDFGSVVEETTQSGGALSLARLAFNGPLDRRASNDTARLVSRLVRSIDFACLEEDGSILIALTQTDLKSAHVVVRRLAAVIRQTQLSQAGGAPQPHITLATLKAGDNVGSLLMRVMSAQAVAAE